MAIELLTCAECGRDWTRKIAHGSGPPPEVCETCAVAPAGHVATQSGGRRPGAGHRLAPPGRRHDVDIPVAFESVPVAEAVGGWLDVPAVCPECAAQWPAASGRRLCPLCGGRRGRAIVGGPAKDDVPARPLVSSASITVVGLLAAQGGIGPGIARRVAAIYPTIERLATAHVEELTQLRGVGVIQAQRIVDAVRNRDVAPQPVREQTADLKDELASLPEVGRTRARRIVERFPTVERLAAANPGELAAVKGVGHLRATSVLHHVRDQPATDAAAAFESVTSQTHSHPFDRVGDPPDDATASSGGVEDDRGWRDLLVVVGCVVCERPLLDVPGRTTTPLCGHCDTGKTLGGAHGRLPTLKKGCRCRECLESIATVREWAADRAAGTTLQDIAERAGLTRERIRQVLKKFDPAAPWDAPARVGRIERAEVEAVARAALNDAREKAAGPCPTCGGTVPGGGRRFCSHDCRERYDLLRWHVDEGRRASQRLRTAEWALANPDSVPDFQLRHARRVLDGTAENVEERRWLIEGSDSFKVAVEAVVNGWPLADLLPAPVREQIGQHLGRNTPGWDEALTAEVLDAEYVQGHQPPSVIATKFGCPLDVVYQALERHGIELRRASRVDYSQVLTAEFLQREYVERGRSGPDIAAELGCNPTTVYAALRRHALHQDTTHETVLREVLTAEFLRHEYVERGRSLSDIAAEVGCGHAAVRNALARHDIEARASTHASVVEELTAEFLQREYVEHGRSGPDIAAELGCNPTTVYAALRRHGIEARSSTRNAVVEELTAEFLQREYVEHGRSGPDIAAELGCNPTTVYAALRRHGIGVRDGGRKSWEEILTREFLRREYVERGRSGSDVAEEVGCNPSVLYAWMDRHGIERRARTYDETNYTEEWLRAQYLVEGRSASELADEAGLTVAGLYSALRKYGIRRDEPVSRSQLTRELLLHEIVARGRSPREVAEDVGCERATVYAAMKRHGIAPPSRMDD